MLRIALMSAAAAIMVPAAASAATFFQFQFDWSAGGTEYSLFGTTDPGQNAPGTYDVASGMNFSIDGVDQGFMAYDGRVGSVTVGDFTQRSGEVNVLFADAGGGDFTATLQNNFTWFTSDPWNFSQADQGGTLAYTLSAGNFYIHDEGQSDPNPDPASNLFIPGNNDGFTSDSFNVGRNNIPGTATVIPLPAALPLLATALFGLGVLGWRRRAA